jgi:hypothetical protein
VLAVWWGLTHVLVGSAFVVLGAPWPLKGAALLAIAAHAIARVPKPTPRLVLRSDGRAELPDNGLRDLHIGPRSRFTSWWVRLELRGAGRVVDVVLLADQLEQGTWRKLQAELRRGRPGDVLPSARSRDGDARGDLR